jgi:hypothetical protein
VITDEIGGITCKTSPLDPELTEEVLLLPFSAFKILIPSTPDHAAIPIATKHKHKTT